MLKMSGGLIELTFGYVYWDIFYDDGEYVEIHNLYVAPEHRGGGYARALLKSAIALIKKQYPKTEIRIIAHPKEPGIDPDRLKEFYLSLGLVIYYPTKSN